MKKRNITRRGKTSLYEMVAEKVGAMVDDGVFKPGEKVPSIRGLSQQFQVSVNTVKTAYEYLEDRCVIEAKPQSGYYVCVKLPEPPKAPAITRTAFDPAESGNGELTMRIMSDISDDTRVQFGAAIPEPSLVPAEKLSRILASETKKFRDESVAYSMPPGSERLRTQIAKRMIKAGCSLGPDEIVITTGASEAVFLALSVLCKPGGIVAMGSPIYFNFIHMINEMGLRVLEIPSSPVDGINLKALEIALEKNYVDACLVVTNCNNPLGNNMPDERKAELVNLLSRNNVPLIEDDINGDLSFTENRPSVAKAWDNKGNVLLCSSFSKTLAPGYRVGWIAPGKFLSEIMYKKTSINIASASPTQLAVAEFLKNGGYDSHLRAIRKVYYKKIVQMADAIGRCFPKGTFVTRPKGGFTLWVELPEKIQSLDLYKRAEVSGITLAPGAIFSTTGKFNNCIRLNAAFWSEKTRWAVEALGKMAVELNG